ncbi:MAG: hypothetical protein U1F67_20275 [Rubrivivax sp.]
MAEVALGQHDAALREAVHGREVVFIGSSALLADAVMTPQGQTSGTMALAQAYAAFNQGKARPGSKPAPALDALLLLLALPGSLPRRGCPAPAHDTLVAGTALLAISVAAVVSLVRGGAPTDWQAPLATSATAWLAALLHAPPRPGRGAARPAHELAVAPKRRAPRTPSSPTSATRSARR